MKRPPPLTLHRTALAAATLLLTLAPPPADAAPVDDNWRVDVHGGTWHTGANWANGGVPDDWGSATFNPAAGATTRSAIVIDADVQLGSLVIQGYQSGTHDPQAAGWTFSGPGVLNLQSPTGGPGTIDFSYLSNVVGSVATVENHVVVNQGLNLWGNNYGTTSRTILDWRAASTTAPQGITLLRATIDIEAVAGSLGSGPVRFAMDAVNRIYLSNANPTSWPDANVDGAFSNDLILENSISELVANYYDNGRHWNINVTGAISEVERQSMNYLNGSGGNGGVRYVISGNNTYTGNTNVGGANTGPTIARATTNTAFGTGNSDINLGYERDTVELANDITVSGKTLNMSGGGYQGAGALNSVFGNNEWAGAIKLGGSADNRIGVASGSTLTVSGVISGDRVLRKVGLGTVILTNDNTFTSGLAIDSGSVVAASVRALGDGDVSLSSGGELARLAIAAGVEAEITGDLLLGSNSILTFDLTGLLEGNDSLLSVLGNQVGSASYTVELLGAEGITTGIFSLMTIEGSFEASHFNLSTSGLSGGLTWVDGTLFYDAQAIPEPGTVVLGLFGAAAIVYFRRRASKV